MLCSLDEIRFVSAVGVNRTCKEFISTTLLFRQVLKRRDVKLATHIHLLL